MTDKLYCVYILTNQNNRVLYTGVTSDLVKRIGQHRMKLINGFTKRYNTDKLVYFETTTDVNSALNREKQIKSGSRRKKIELIESMNPDWKDLYDEIL